jgi:hypothetical protein
MPSTRRATDLPRVTTPLITGDGGTALVPQPRRRLAIDAELPPEIGGVSRRQPLPEVGRIRRGDKTLTLGSVGEKAREIGLSQLTGQFTITGKQTGADPSREGLAIYGAAELVAAGVDVAARIKSGPLRQKVLERLETTLAWSLEKRFINNKEKAFAGSMTTLMHLARATERSDRPLFNRAIGAMLTGLDRVRDVEMRAFYMAQLLDLEKKLNKPDQARLRELERKTFPQRPLVEEYTANRTRPLEVRHYIHTEFWKEELGAFKKSDGWTLVKKNARDTERVYRGILKDPLGKKKPLEVNMVVKKGELDYLAEMSDPNVHVLTYSGHSSVGGNGSQSIDAAGAMVGEFPKLVFAANCRGKDNYAEFTNKWPGAHVIMTEEPTYSENGQARLAALFHTLAAGQSYSWMRGNDGDTAWEESPNNYFYPDEMRKFRFMDADEDGRADASASLGRDRLFDVDARLGGVKFDRALAFTNSELFYHWEVELENGKRSHYGRKYGDSLEAAGPFFDEKKGEVVRVKREGSKVHVSYAPSVARTMDENLLAAHVTMHSIMALAKEANGGVLTKHEALRAALMGAQAISYLDVYFETQPLTYEKFFKQIGIASVMDDDDIDGIFKKYDSHANNEQVAAFQKMLEKKYAFDLEKWTPKFGRFDAHVDSASTRGA